ncbi:MAG TPA: cytochrome c biogenesis heme-transporting ATPase CcmA [Rhodanobacteraceae bacterium]|nr:cytochrome c biogenesis heme-transporting ATPase CcmA [Rhodanobacteraceae bacterium]
MNDYAANPILLEARALTFTRQDERVFGPLDFAVHRGEAVLVEGDNGSGKTTLLRVLASLLQASAGELRLYDAPLTRAAAAGEILLLGHHLGLKADLTPLENLRYVAGLFGQRRGADASQALASVGLAGFEHEPVRRLSAGQRKRAALARLLIVPAALWLLDEPYANLDREGIALVNRLLERHVHTGGSALVTSHGTVDFLAGSPRRIELRAA